MQENPTPVDLSVDTAISVPKLGNRARRFKSYESNRPIKNSRPVGWLFFGAHSMPHSEHLIPFLN